MAWTRDFGVAGAGLGTDAEQGREDRRLEQHAPMVIDLAFQAGKAFRVGTGLTFQNDGSAIRHDQAIPNQQRAGLAEGHLGVVLADKACALRDQQNTAGRAVIDVIGYLGGDLASCPALVVAKRWSVCAASCP
jgi:hypothetical protein